MAPSILPALIFTVTFAVAVVSMHGLALRNGMMDHRSIFAKPGSLLPNSAIPITKANTGIALLDEYLALMNAVFHVDLDTRNVVAHTGGTHFLGTLSAAWMIMLVEAHQVGGSFVLWTYVLEVLGELAGVGMFTPVWALWHLRSIAPSSQPQGLSKRDAATLPWAFLLGHILPSFAMILSDPAGEGLLSQQYWVLARLIHPVFTYALWQVFRLFVAEKPGRVAARSWYVWAIVAATFMHSLSLAPVALLQLSPDWLNAKVVADLDLWALFVPSPFWLLHPEKVDFARGVSRFLQWDEILCSLSICTLATTLYLRARENVGARGIGFSKLLQVGGFLGFGGPGAAAAFLMLERDEVYVEAAPAASTPAKKTQ